MKKLPRIHSLSTVGIIHHRDIDYKLHGLRTDFVGDSGCGKSIIADLLQLIFVGSDEFEAVKQPNEEETRKPNGLVLDSLGYIFVNIEVGHERYIAIGTIIEKNNPATKSFIVQKGLDFTKDAILESLEKPILPNDFVHNESQQIIYYKNLSSHFHDKGMGFYQWTELETFHEILSNPENAIIPFDFKKNKNALVDYANIIRAFARGNDIKINNNKNLQEFLFGNNDKNEILKKYQKEINNIDKQKKDYTRNKEEVRIFREKLEDIKDLKEKSEYYESELHKYLNENLSYWHFEKIKRTSEFNTQKQIVENAHAEASQIVVNLNGIEHNIKDKVDEAKTEEEQNQGVLSTKKTLYNKLVEIEKWVEKFKTDNKGLLELYQEDKNKATLQKDLQALKGLLIQKNLSDFFEKSGWVEGFQRGHEWHLQKKNEIDKDILLKKNLQTFIDLKNPNSLGYWAINNLEKPITHEQESIIQYFQSFPINKIDASTERTLVNPKDLFESDSIKNIKQGIGFWLNLSGVWEWIKYIPNRILDTDDSEKLELFIKQWNTQLQEEINKLSNELQSINELNDIFKDFQAQQGLNAYLKRETFWDFVHKEEFKNIDLDGFKTYLNCLNNKFSIQTEYKDIKLKAESSAKKYSDLNTVSNNISVLSNNYSQLLKLLKNFQEFYLEKTKNTLTFTENDLIFDESIDFVEYEKVASTNFQTARNKLPTEKLWQEVVSDLVEANTELEDAEQEYDKYLESEKVYLEIQNRPSIIEKDRKFLAFNEKYKSIIEKHLQNEKYKYDKTEPDFDVMKKALFPNSNIDDIFAKSGVITQLNKELNDIIRKNQDLSFGKLELIKGLLEQVEVKYNEYREIERKIEKFLKPSANKISGGFNANLSWIDSTKKELILPISWIDDFISDINEGQMYSKLAPKVEDIFSMDEKLEKAFKEITNSNALSPNIKDLLNPHSYYELKYEMESEYGRRTKGSAGQAYSALALLCIARLSIIEEEKANKQIKGIRFMAIDEAQGLGSNYNLLYKIAQEYDYQIITLSTAPVGSFQEGKQYIYMLHRDPDADAINYPPFAIFSSEDRNKYET